MSELENLSPVDRISNLPDCLLCHILSYLPTREVVATSILSSRWATLWTHVPYLDFEYSTNYSPDQDDKTDKRMRFTHFVSKVLKLLKAPTVETFRLNYEGEIDPSQTNKWICTAIGRGVKELDFSSCGWNRIELPSAFTCESLVVLKLGNTFSLNYPSYVHLPSLKILQLGSHVYYDEDSVDKVISGCPILEDLHVSRSGRYLSTLNISIPTLKRLRVDIFGIITSGKVQINSPGLHTLVIQHFSPVDYLLNKLPNLFDAEVHISNQFQNIDDCVLKLLRGFYNVKILSFSVISCGIDISSDDLPLFHNLVNLKLGIDSFDCHVLKTLLENSPNLKVLNLSKTQEFKRESRVEYEYESCWSQPSRVPECLTSHLETFYVRGLRKFDRLECVKYILKNAQVLVKATVCAHFYQDLEGKSYLLKKVSMFPRGSKTCQLVFH